MQFCAAGSNTRILYALLLLNSVFHGNVKGDSDTALMPPRTFARRGFAKLGREIAFRSPEPFSLISVGDYTLEVIVRDPEDSCWIALFLNNKYHSKLERQPGADGGDVSRFAGSITVDAGTSILHAVMIDHNTEEQKAAAYSEVLARSADFDLESSARAVCAGQPDSTIRTATSECDALLQMAREELLRRNSRKAADLFVDVVVLSAKARRQGDRAHAEHVYPYLQLAIAATQLEDSDSARRAMQTVHRLQPGYELPTPRGQSSAGKTLAISAEAVRRVDLEPIWHLVCEWTARELVGPPGMLAAGGAAGNPGGHYRLLSHIASQLRGALIVEMGSMHGASALSLALGHPSNRVVTYNIVDDFSKNAAACGLSGPEYLAAVHDANLRVEWRLEDIMASEEGMRELLEAGLIHIDINHHGDIEDAILQFLLGNAYQGLVLLDDIYLNPAMDAVWAGLGADLCKYDLTDLGHTVAGSGLVDFSCSVQWPSADS